MQDVRPVLVLVEMEGSDLKSPSRLLQTRYRVVTCPVEAVALEYVSESPPAAVLQETKKLHGGQHCLWVRLHHRPGILQEGFPKN